MVYVDLDTDETIYTEAVFDQELIESLSSILANKMLDFMRKGGDVENITPEKVFENIQINK